MGDLPQNYCAILGKTMIDGILAQMKGASGVGFSTFAGSCPTSP